MCHHQRLPLLQQLRTIFLPPPLQLALAICNAGLQLLSTRSQLQHALLGRSLSLCCSSRCRGSTPLRCCLLCLLLLLQGSQCRGCRLPGRHLLLHQPQPLLAATAQGGISSLKLLLSRLQGCLGSLLLGRQRPCCLIILGFNRLLLGGLQLSNPARQALTLRRRLPLLLLSGALHLASRCQLGCQVSSGAVPLLLNCRQPLSKTSCQRCIQWCWRCCRCGRRRCGGGLPGRLCCTGCRNSCNSNCLGARKLQLINRAELRAGDGLVAIGARRAGRPTAVRHCKQRR